MDDRAPLPPSRLALPVAGFVLAFVFFGVLGRLHEGAGFPAGRDLLVERLPLLDLTLLLGFGFLACHAAALAAAWRRERARLPYFFAVLGLFVAVRAVFIALCPYGALPSMVPVYAEKSLSFLRGTAFFDSEQFFSGHTAAPYLYFLLFRSRARWAFLAASAVMALAVLFTHNHYTIDVLGAYFVTHSIHELGRRLFGRLDAEDPLPALLPPAGEPGA